MRKRVFIWCAVAALSAIAATTRIGAQDAPQPFLTGESRPQDMLTARRILMDTIGRNNDYLHDSVDGHFEWNDVMVRARLDAMSSMLLAFPHLYHPNTNVWSEEQEAADAASVSLSTEAVWLDFEGFYALAQEASLTALEASLSTDRDEVVELIEVLEGQCESCHAGYRQERESGRLTLPTE